MARRKSTPRSRSESLPNIKRIHTLMTRGWQVHVCRGRKTVTKLFSDSRFGGKASARAAAIFFRDRLLATMGKNPTPLWRIERSARSNTGYLGVSRTETKTSTGRVRRHITVTARKAPGVAVGRKFSIDELGYREALERAVAWRAEVLRERARRESG